MVGPVRLYDRSRKRCSMEGTDGTRRRFVASSALLGLAGAAGCLRLTQSQGETTAGSGTGSPGDDGQTSTATTSTSSAESTDADGTADDGEATYPPGVSEDGVTETLAFAHRQQVSGETRTVRTTYMGFRELTARLAADDTAVVESSRGPESYVAADGLYQRFVVGDETIYAFNETVFRDYRPEIVGGQDLLSGLVRGGAFAPVGTQTRDGDTLFVLEADAVEDQRALEETESINRFFRESEFPLETFSASALVTPDGLVRSVGATIGGGGDSGTFAVETSAVGATSVTEPSWTATAAEREATFRATLVDDGAFVELVQTGGQSIGASTDVEFDVGAFDGREYYSTRYQGSTSAGATFYLYKTDGTNEFGAPKLGVSKGSRPSSGPAGTWSTDAGLNLRAAALQLVRAMQLG